MRRPAPGAQKVSSGHVLYAVQRESKTALKAAENSGQSSALNRTYTLYGPGVHYVQAEGGEPGITACLACANPV
jgi:hypothetical protein